MAKKGKPKMVVEQSQNQPGTNDAAEPVSAPKGKKPKKTYN